MSAAKRLCRDGIARARRDRTCRDWTIDRNLSDFTQNIRTKLKTWLGAENREIGDWFVDIVIDFLTFQQLGRVRGRSLIV